MTDQVTEASADTPSQDPTDSSSKAQIDVLPAEKVIFAADQLKAQKAAIVEQLSSLQDVNPTINLSSESQEIKTLTSAFDEVIGKLTSSTGSPLSYEGLSGQKSTDLDKKTDDSTVDD